MKVLTRLEALPSSLEALTWSTSGSTAPGEGTSSHPGRGSECGSSGSERPGATVAAPAVGRQASSGRRPPGSASGVSTRRCSSERVRMGAPIDASTRRSRSSAVPGLLTSSW
jgi:hypothetical protein